MPRAHSMFLKLRRFIFCINVHSFGVDSFITVPQTLAAAARLPELNGFVEAQSKLFPRMTKI
jgi:hypothetical protein